MTRPSLHGRRADSPDLQGAAARFDPAEHEAFTKPGPACVTGHAVVLRPDKTFLVCGYAPVLAFPDTPYTRGVVSVIRAGESPGVSPFATKLPPRLDLHASCDHHGNFAFRDLQACRYFVAANVQWMEDGQRQSGTLLSSIALKPGNNFVILSNVPRT